MTDRLITADVARIADAAIVAFLDYQGYGATDKQARDQAVADAVATFEGRAVRPPADPDGECAFCHGDPVFDAASWVDGKRRDPVPCPRCGKTHARAADRDDNQPVTEAELLNGYGAEVDRMTRERPLPHALRRDTTEKWPR